LSVCALFTTGPLTLIVALSPAVIRLPTFVSEPALIVRLLPAPMIDEL
jgi:hypothetical protein